MFGTILQCYPYS